MSMASTGIFKSTICFLGSLPPGSQRATPFQVDGKLLYNASCGQWTPSCVTPHSCLPSGSSTLAHSPFSFLHGILTSWWDLEHDLMVLTSSCLLCQPIRLAFGLVQGALGDPFGLYLPLVSSILCTQFPSRSNLLTLHSVLCCAQGTSASDLAAMAFSALPS
jgi:hypothetical protein